MKIHNNTEFAVKTIDEQPVILTIKNLWRQREVVLRTSPTDPTKVISDGTTFDGEKRIICHDAREMWAYQLNEKEASGRVYFIQE